MGPEGGEIVRGWVVACASGTTKGRRPAAARRRGIMGSRFGVPSSGMALAPGRSDGAAQPSACSASPRRPWPRSRSIDRKRRTASTRRSGPRSRMRARRKRLMTCGRSCGDDERGRAGRRRCRKGRRIRHRPGRAHGRAAPRLLSPPVSVARQANRPEDESTRRSGRDGCEEGDCRLDHSPPAWRCGPARWRATSA